MIVSGALQLVARLLLAGVFALAGITKVLDRGGFRRSLMDFGLPSILAGPFGVVLPFFELMVALALIPVASARYSALGALALLLLFIAGIGASLARGRTPDCRCFGHLHSKPISWQLLVRNCGLGILAVFIVIRWNDPGPSLVAWLIALSPTERAVVLGATAGLALLTAQNALLVRLLRQNAQVLHRLAAAAPAVATPAPEVASPTQIAPAAAGRPLGSPAPAFALTSVRGDTVTLDVLRAAGTPVLLIFSDAACGPCSALLPEIALWQRERSDALTLALISRGPREVNRAKTEEHGLPWVLLQRDREVADAYGVFGTPSAVLVDPGGTIGSPLAQGDAEIRQLVARLATSKASVAVPAPDFALPDLDGEPVTLAAFRGQRTLMLFWNPGCGYCQQMLAALRAWETRPPAERAQLLVVSTGTKEDNRALGLRSTIVLDPAFAVASRYGATGTPSAVLLDEEARPMTQVAVGVSDVLALAGQPESPADGTVDVSVVRTDGGPRRAPLTALPLDGKPLKENCVQDELLSDGSLVLYNSCRQEILTLNATAALIWEYCDGDHDCDAIAREVRDVFPAAFDAARDVREILDRLLQAGMIGPATPSDVTTSFARPSAATA